MISDTVFLIAAGGSSRRFGTDDKLFADLHGLPVFLHCIRTVAPLLPPGNIILAVHPDRQGLFEQELRKHLPDVKVRFVHGGETRTLSVRNALREAAKIPAAEYAAIHDAARPFLTQEMFRICLDSCREHGGALLCKRITDTVKVTDSAGHAVKTLDRDLLRGAETPQIFPLRPLIAAYEKALESGRSFTDDAMIMEEFTDTKPYLAEHRGDNRKITYPEDLTVQG